MELHDSILRATLAAIHNTSNRHTPITRTQAFEIKAFLVHHIVHRYCETPPTQHNIQTAARSIAQTQPPAYTSSSQQRQHFSPHGFGHPGMPTYSLATPHFHLWTGQTQSPINTIPPNTQQPALCYFCFLVLPDKASLNTHTATSCPVLKARDDATRNPTRPPE